MPLFRKVAQWVGQAHRCRCSGLGEFWSFSSSKEPHGRGDSDYNSDSTYSLEGYCTRSTDRKTESLAIQCIETNHPLLKEGSRSGIDAA
jgi:hypothetical protein